MKVQELQSILNYCNIDKTQRVFINIKYADGTIENCYIESFQQYSDGLVLNVTSDVKPIN